MVNLPPPDHVADLLEDEPVHPESAPIILYHASAQPKGYVSDDDMEKDEEEDPDEDPKEELIEQVVPEPNNMKKMGVGDDDKEMEMDDEDNSGNNDKGDAKVINPYEEVDPLNRPPPTSDEETEFAPPVVSIVDDNDEPIPSVIQFGGNYHIGECSSIGSFLAGNGWVHSPGPIGCNLESIHRGVQGWIGKCLIALDTAVRRRIPEDLLFQKEPPIHAASTPCLDDPYIIVRDVAIAARDDNGDDSSALMDSQPSEPHGSPRHILIMSPRKMTQVAIEKLITDAIARDRATRGNPSGAGGSGGNNGDQGGEPPIRKCTYANFMNITECAERNKAKFVTATLQGRALTWWNLQVATLGLEVANGKSWTEMKNMMKEEFCPPEEIQRMEKVEAYIRVLPDNIKGETTSFKPVVLNDAVRMAHTLMEQKLVAKAERVAESNKRKWENKN
ncbi:hypothetical protein Tco_0008779 [Tanacetum coccineum]